LSLHVRVDPAVRQQADHDVGRGDAYDNAMAESFFAMLEREVLNRRRFKTQAEARMAIFEWLEGFPNIDARQLFNELCIQFPGRFTRRQYKSLLRRVNLWRQDARARTRHRPQEVPAVE
jgi:hypothetical protein